MATGRFVRRISNSQTRLRRNVDIYATRSSYGLAVTLWRNGYGVHTHWWDGFSSKAHALRAARRICGH